MEPSKARYLEYTDEVVLNEETDKPIDEDVYINGTIMRFKDGKLHGDGGDAAICTEDGHLEFWQHGRLHREHGPAVCSVTEDENGNTYAEYWLNGQRIS